MSKNLSTRNSRQIINQWRKHTLRPSNFLSLLILTLNYQTICTLQLWLLTAPESKIQISFADMDTWYQCTGGFYMCHYWRSNNTPRCHEDKIDDSVVHALLPSPTGAPQGQANQYRGFIDCAQTILREEGTGAFLKGIEPRVLWVGIGGSIFFGVLEKTKSVLAQRSSRRDAKLKL
ncbi:uncharacterized protein LOC120658076 isoform X2 [Panicum virgatum]|uniref:uncharacterized protein LOC120658076 isoform X2 n=1 Tax=Panicum virgatum TaxID=38727 RepID=UPI0019D581C6|nr:uncharacterized protein LOC120658076 isoform X2 [Panicum virgatum]